jgi:hypothetical protein
MSGARMGGVAFPQVVDVGARATIILNGTDPDRDDQPTLRSVSSVPRFACVRMLSDCACLAMQSVSFVIVALPAYGNLSYTLDGVEYPITSNGFVLPPFVGSVSYSPTANSGGAPLSTLTYAVSDGRLQSAPLGVPIFVQCPAGSFVNGTTCSMCLPGRAVFALGCVCLIDEPLRWFRDDLAPCAPGSYQPTESFSCCVPSTFSKVAVGRCAARRALPPRPTSPCLDKARVCRAPHCRSLFPPLRSTQVAVIDTCSM